MEKSKSSVNEITGVVIKYGDNINTDFIIPSQYLDNPDPDYYSKHIMEGIDQKFGEKVKLIMKKFNLSPIIVGGKNFGSGSSREQATQGIKHSGVKAVLAESFNATFFRNAINVGLPIASVPNISKTLQNDYHIKINLQNGILDIIQPEGEQIKFPPLEKFLLERLHHGGLLPELKKYIEKQQNYK